MKSMSEKTYRGFDDFTLVNYLAYRKK